MTDPAETQEGVSMTISDTQLMCERYQALVSRALEIINKAPYWKFAYEAEEWAHLTIEGDVATIAWPEAYIDYDSPIIERESCSFKASLLLITDKELAIWKKEQFEIYEKAQKERDAEVKVDKETAERALYARLKERYDVP